MLFNSLKSRKYILCDALKRFIVQNSRNFTKTSNVSSASEGQCKNTAQILAASSKPVDADQAFRFHSEWPLSIQQDFVRDMVIIEDFISVPEEQLLLYEIEQVTKRMRYEYDHWDNAIHGFRETQKKNWYPQNRELLDRVGRLAFENEVMPYIHILDLAADGVIKPHVDSSRYCGNIIAGLSLLTDCIMRLRRIDETKYYQGKDSEHIQQAATGNKGQRFEYYADVLLKRRSLYVMRDSARYKFTHEVLPTGEFFKGTPVEKSRRVSVICRNEP